MSIIAGISTPIGSGAISIVRLSGEGALGLALRFFTSNLIDGEPQPNRMYLGTFCYEQIKDRCMMVYFACPRSYTGEDMVEFQLHGGVRLTEEVLRALIKGGATLAKEGEFTRRAFLNGKISLDEAEGVMSLINAESQAEISAAYSALKGSVSKKIKPSLQKLLDVISYLEASFDYPEEMEDEVEDAPRIIREIGEELTSFAQTAEKGRLIKNGVSVALVGKPNAGKSSLLNAMLKEERAIVTEIAGTTRDTISESLIHKGIRINLLDTAGIRQSADVIEKIGIQRSLDALRRADVVVYLLDSPKGDSVDSELIKEARGRIIVVNNKTDIFSPQNEYFSICAKTGQGVEELLDKIIGDVANVRASGELLTLDRHIDAVNGALKAVNEALQSIQNQMTADCVLVDLKRAYTLLGEISGEQATDDIIDRVFSKFCVGK